MKRDNIIYWVVTGLFSAFMLFSSIPDIMVTEEARTFMRHLGYPDYFTHFIGVMKLLGVVAILIPGYPRIKEWAYAGLFFDLIGAVFSLMMVDKFQPPMLIMLLPVSFLWISYLYHHKRWKHKYAAV